MLAVSVEASDDRTGQAPTGLRGEIAARYGVTGEMRSYAARQSGNRQLSTKAKVEEVVAFWTAIVSSIGRDVRAGSPRRARDRRAPPPGANCREMMLEHFAALAFDPRANSRHLLT